MSGSLISPIDTSDDALELVGGKGRSLAQMTRAGFDVPGGFLLTTNAYREFVTDNHLQAKIVELARPEIVDNRASFEAASIAIQQLIGEHKLSTDIIELLQDAYAGLEGKDPAVAVRSSANAEDLPGLSFAGQQETYLNISGADALIAAVRNCWASLWTPQAISYRHQHEIEQDSVAMAVVVQIMVPAKVAGILFTANPATGVRNEMIINASFGLGEAVVGGQVTPDTYIVDRDSMTVKETIIGPKEVKIISDGTQGTRMEDVSAEDRELSSLSDSLLDELTALAVKVEQHFDGLPQDTEWAIAADKLWLLQARPITNLPPAPPKDVTFPEIPGAQLYKRMAAEIMSEPLSPLFESLYLRALYDSQTWPDDWEWKGTHTRNYLSNFIITTVNGYAYAAIYVDQGEESRVHWEKVRSTRGKLPWYKTLWELFKPTPIPAIQTDKVNVNNPTGVGRLLLLGEIKDTPQHWIWVLYQWWRMVRKADVIRVWQKQSLPNYLELLDRWRPLDPSQATNQELLQGIRSLTVAEARYWHVLRGIIGAAKGSDQALQNFLMHNAPDEGFSSGIFLSGFKSKTLVAEMDMRALAEMIRNNRAIYELIIVTPITRFLEQLKAHPEGKQVADAIDEYLNNYGKQVFDLDFVEPALIEAPLPFITNLKAMVCNSGFDLIARQQEVAKKRRAKWIQAIKFFFKNRIESDSTAWMGGGTVSKSVLLEFIRLYWTARINYPTREEAIFYMGNAWILLRPFALELGRRLTDIGTVSQADDVFYLTNEELQQAIEACANDKALPELKEHAEARRHLRQQRQRLTQPAAIPEENSLPWGTGDKSAFDTIKINADDASVMRGFAVSPGIVTGVASVVMSPDDFDQMRPDTILVCPLTTPAWTQLFPYASGLVTDIGSITAHGSIVAREYGIPAVLGTGNGTRLIKDGQMIAVDGDKGTVTIIEE
ncbi:MAG: PEP/pyruvate-binding domain-containing protein [Pseudomonadales bacterium]|nr:PEP/pyruvate-binding domain-containing protein [Pseudomonadales bacterium]